MLPLTIFKPADFELPGVPSSTCSYYPNHPTGLLNGTGMIGGVFSVTYLGQGVGNSVIQAKIIVR